MEYVYEVSFRPCEECGSMVATHYRTADGGESYEWSSDGEVWHS
jgi:hypothetical protein